MHCLLHEKKKIEELHETHESPHSLFFCFKFQFVSVTQKNDSVLFQDYTYIMKAFSQYYTLECTYEFHCVKLGTSKDILSDVLFHWHDQWAFATKVFLSQSTTNQKKDQLKCLEAQQRLTKIRERTRENMNS